MQKSKFFIQKMPLQIDYLPEGAIKIDEALKSCLIKLKVKDAEIAMMRRKLQEFKQKHIDLYEFSPISYFSIRKDHAIIETNLTGALLLEKERSKIINKNFNNFIHSDYLNEFKHYCQKVLETGCKQICEIQLLKANHSAFHARLESISANNSQFGFGMEEQIQLSIFDIDTQKKAEIYFKESEAKFKSVVESAKDWIWCCDLRGNYTYCNPYVESTLGYTTRDIIGRNLFLFLSSKDHILLKNHWASLITKKIGWECLILQYHCKNGTYTYLESTATPMRDCYGNFIGFIGVDRDITERKNAEVKLQKHQLLLAQSAHTNSMAEIASLLAHEINQPLTAIAAFSASCTQIIKSGMYEPERLTSILGKLEEQAERTGAIIYRMKSFLCYGEMQLEITDINKLIQDLKDLCYTIYPYYKLSLKLILDKALPRIKVDKVQLEQVIFNLLRNSIEAAIKSYKAHNLKIIIQTKLLKYDIRVSVQDNGPGFEIKELNKLFDKNYTTKQKGVGIGLGLSICRTIIQAHGGKIIAKPMVTCGACIEFTLPRKGSNENI